MKLTRIAASAILIGAAACSTAPQTPDERTPASEIVGYDGEDAYNNMHPKSPSIDRNLIMSVGVGRPTLIEDTDLSARRRTRQENYRKSNGAFFVKAFEKKVETYTSGAAYEKLRATIGQCGCSILKVWGEVDRYGCHSKGQAVDLMSAKCDGGIVASASSAWGATPAGRKRYAELVACERKFFMSPDPRGKLKDHNLWQRAKHFDHCHFTLGCQVDGHVYY